MCWCLCWCLCWWIVLYSRRWCLPWKDACVDELSFIVEDDVCVDACIDKLFGLFFGLFKIRNFISTTNSFCNSCKSVNIFENLEFCHLDYWFFSWNYICYEVAGISHHDIILEIKVYIIVVYVTIMFIML